MAHYILFSGHMVDKPGRPTPRFPASKEAAAAAAIHRVLSKIKAASSEPISAASAGSANPASSEPISAASAGSANNASTEPTNAESGQLIAIAAAACGGDILFHEACLQLQIPSEIYLGIPVDAFEQTSVAFAGPSWINRYRALVSKLPVHILHPNATASAPDSIWEEANQWMLDAALVNGGHHLTLIVLWDQSKGDGLGGTEHMVRVAEAHKGAVEIIDINKL